MSAVIYLEYCFTVIPIQPATDILIAELGGVGFESFVETVDGILAYIQKADWQPTILDQIQILKHPNFNVTYTTKEIPQENWNAAWEENFNPIHIESLCVVRAPFHEKYNVPFDIVIEPKMSFGTGHHETTHMMLQHLLENDFKGKSVLDMGSGTGVLAILTAMKGATQVDAIDIDNWCYLNAKENIARNNCTHINVYEGDASLLKKQSYDCIIANINRNVLVKDIPVYVKHLTAKGQLFLSGFYEQDILLISKVCTENGLKMEKKVEKNNWVSVKYVF